MSRRQPTYRAILDHLARGDRSTLFWFLVERHDEIVKQTEGQRIRWAALCVRFAEQGLTDFRGLPASRETARKTWLRARQVVAKARAKKAAADADRRPGDVYPSRIPKTWRPEVVAPQPAPALPPPPPPPRPTAAARPPISDEARARAYNPALTPEAQEVVNRVFEDLLTVDRKKFGR